MHKAYKKNPVYRPTWVEIDLAALKFNLEKVKQRIPEKTKILVAVKADAYGHGIKEIAHTLVGFGVDYLGVATTDEALLLRGEGIRTPILIFGAVLESEAIPIIRHGITQTVPNLAIAKFLSKEAMRLGKIITVHAKIDTGMGRIGVWHEEAISFIKEIRALKNVMLEGIYTHLPSADEQDKEFTNRQLTSFNRLIDELEDMGICIPLKHAANSMGLLRFTKSHLNLVRPGLMIYGLYPHRRSPMPCRLKPVMAFKTRVVYLKEVPKNRSISYGRTYITQKKLKIATLPVGYGDGYPRFLSNRGYVLVRGKKAPIRGKVCMDQTMVDVSAIKGIRIGDEAVLMGAQAKERISAESLAALGDTISYEIVCWISKRVPRFYHRIS
ncbi:MAG: alanine racemase [Candidatus Omnitrophota bacterium]